MPNDTCRLRDGIREEAAFIAFELWQLLISFLATHYESFPHMYVPTLFIVTTLIWDCRWGLLLSRSLAVAWSSFLIWRTDHYYGVFSRIYRSSASPCNADLFDNYLSLLRVLAVRVSIRGLKNTNLCTDCHCDRTWYIPSSYTGTGVSTLKCSCKLPMLSTLIPKSGLSSTNFPAPWPSPWSD